MTLTSELALLLVARGESETLIVLLRGGPDLTLYMEDAGMFVINGLRLPGILRLISYSKRKVQSTIAVKITLMMIIIIIMASLRVKENDNVHALVPFTNKKVKNETIRNM